MWLLAALFALIPQRFVSNDALQPYTRASASGEWGLAVDPSTRDGAGKSTLRISRKGVAQWTGEKPFTFQDAVIDDSGISVGYAYTGGLESGEGVFAVAVLDAQGKTLLVDETERQSRSESHAPPQPMVRRMVLHPDRHVVIFCVDNPDDNASDESWWTIQLSPAKKLEVVYAGRGFEDPQDHQWTFGMAAIRGTPLTLAQWSTWGSYKVSGAGPGSEFALYDESLKLVWSLPLTGDLDVEDDSLRRELLEQMRNGGGILDTRSERRFELRHVAKAERVSYEVARDPGADKGWTVREVARAPFIDEAPKPAPEPAKWVLPAAGSAALDVGTQNASGPVRDIEEFSIEDSGRITFVRNEEARGAVTLVTIDSSGSVLRQVAVAAIEPDSDAGRRWSPLAKSDWLLTLSQWGSDDPQSRAWRIQGETGAVQELVNFHGPRIETIESTPDGGFVLLGDHSLEYTIYSELRRCAADGTTIWSCEEAGYGQADGRSGLCSPEDFAIEADGSILVLDHSDMFVQFFDAQGKFLKVLELENAWDSESSYLTQLLIEPSGSILIHDIHDTGTWRRISRDGKQLASFAPKRENGSKDVGGGVRVGPGGKLWGHDGQQFLDYDEHGVAHERFGTAADPGRLWAISRVYFDGTGRLAIPDERTHAVHLFTADGRRSAVCIPDATDFDEEHSIDAVLTGADGTIFVQPDNYEDSFLAFSADGKRLGRVELGGQRVAFNRRTRERWAGGEGEDDVVRLRRFDADGKLAFEELQRPDGGFFEGVRAMACGPDGSLVVLDAPSFLLRDSVTGRLCCFSEKGEPRKQFELPGIDVSYESHMQVGRRWVVMHGGGPSAVVVSLIDGKCARFDAADPEDQQCAWAMGLSPDETEVWALQAAPLVLHRFSLPK